MGGIQARFQLNWPDFELDVDLDLPDRGVTALFGESGSGKTTLLRCVAGLERAPRGRLQVAGEVWQDERRWLPTHRRPLGYVFQEASLFSHLSVLGNLKYGLKRVAGARPESLDQAIELLGIGYLLERKPEKLSGGERQRIAIARALAVSPLLLLMDEPLAALDHRRRSEILTYLERLRDELDIPVLYVSHAPDEVARLADHLVVLAGGRAVVQGPLTETLARLDLPVFLGADAGAVLETKVDLIESDWHLARLDFGGGSLWTWDSGLQVGQRARVRVLARDVSIACVQPGPSSIQNVLPGVIDAIVDEELPGTVLARVRVGEVILLARMTKRSAVTLELASGTEVWAQIKSVALLE